MNVLLLGNGFDIYHYLPTKYHNFLNVVNYLVEYYSEEYKTIGSVFSDELLQEDDPYIAKCYERHKEIYDSMPLNAEKINEIIRICSKNLWFSYFTKSFNKDLGWIDFEREITYVIEVFFKFLSIASVNPNLSRVDTAAYYLIKHFGFFMETKIDSIFGTTTHKIIDEYIIEYPQGSKNLTINKAKIIEKMSVMLDEVAKALKLYLECFVDVSLSGIVNQSSTPICSAVKNMDYTISFNYTDTYEKLYSQNTIYHIHGKVTDRIIIGVNPDSNDNVETINVSFIAFKKYYQRTLFGTDYKYLEWIRDINEANEDYYLTIMGHSLDDTDKDILEEVFLHASEIYILYHSEMAKKDYIKNLIKIFGKDGFDDLKKNKKLTFYSLDTDLSDFSLHLNSNFGEEIIHITAPWN